MGRWFDRFRELVTAGKHLPRRHHHEKIMRSIITVKVTITTTTLPFIILFKRLRQSEYCVVSGNITYDRHHGHHQQHHRHSSYQNRDHQNTRVMYTVACIPHCDNENDNW